MKEQIHSSISETQNDFTGGSELLNNNIKEPEKIQENTENKTSLDMDKINLDFEPLRNQIDIFVNISENFFNGENFEKLSKQQQKKWAHDKMKSAFPIMPDHMINLLVATHFEGDCGRSPEERPDWLDMEKFKRGQKFARDHFFGLSYSQLLSLYILFSFEDGLKPMIVTGKSSTPYTSFKR